MQKITKEERLIAQMLTENTGVALLDSGGAYGRNWERNQGKTVEQFRKQHTTATAEENWGYDVNVPVFQYLRETIRLNETCDKFNRLKCPNWDGFTYGISDTQTEWLKKHGFETDEEAKEHAPKAYNTYNDPDYFGHLSQVLQGTFIYNTEEGEWYCLLQIHGGCDVRGGYTDAKLVQFDYPGGMPEGLEFFPTPDYSLVINGKTYDVRGPDVCEAVSGESVELPPATEGMKVEAYLSTE
ncbi:hypothetical protein KGP36_01755 [Patescibacteria group bacterium]|nr:hypothetical protein [Patescibacteria group bacterium]